MTQTSKKKVFICPLFRIEDLRNIFPNEEIIFFPFIKKSKLIFIFQLILTLVMKYFYKDHFYEVWIIDQPLLKKNLSKFLFYISKKLDLNYLSMNVEFDLKNLNDIKCKKFVLFENHIFPFINIRITNQSLSSKKLKNIKFEILYFGELNLDFSRVKDPEILNIIFSYQENKEPSIFMDETDDYLNNLYMVREIGNLSRFEELICARNAQRFYYLKYLQNKFPGYVKYIGNDLIKNGLIAERTNNSRSNIKSRISESKINLDLGSKSFSHTLYPRSLMILNENPQSLLQLCQYDSENYIKNLPSQLVRGSALESKIEKILQTR